jgi:hypothetical protein
MVPHLPEIDRPAKKKIHEQPHELQRKFPLAKNNRAKKN